MYFFHFRVSLFFYSCIRLKTFLHLVFSTDKPGQTDRPAMQGVPLAFQPSGRGFNARSSVSFPGGRVREIGISAKEESIGRDIRV